MSYLLDLVKSFDEAELQKFQQLVVVGKEQMLRDEYANKAQFQNFDETQLLATFQLSKSHFDKINSILLDKTLIHFAGNDLQAKLNFLINKQLYDLVLHELKLEEKRLVKQNDKPSLTSFYKEALRVTLLFNFSNFPVEQIDSYCKAYIQLLQEEEKEEKYRALAKHQEVLLRYYYNRKGGLKIREAGFKKLQQWQKEIKGKKLFESEVALHLAFSSFYETSEPEMGLQYLQEADKVARNISDKIPDRDKAFLLAMISNLLIKLGHYKDGIEKYEELFSRFPHLAGARVFHPFQFTFGLLILKDFKRASEVMEEYLQPFLKNENARNFHFDILRLYAIYHLLNLETEKAGIYLQRILQFGKDEFTTLGDVLFRFVHNVYCIQTGDLALAADVLKKNIKFMDSKLEVEGMIPYKKMFLDLGKIIRFKSKNQLNKAIFPIQEIELGIGLARLYQDLIKLPVQQ